MFDPSALEYPLLGVSAVAYPLLAFQLLRRREAGPKADDLSGAFKVLEGVVKEKAPTIPEGFTWREVVREAQTMGLDVDWRRVGLALDEYEARRYGGAGRANADYGEVLVLARRLRGRRSKG